MAKAKEGEVVAKKRKRAPSLRAKNAALNLVANGGNKARAIRDAGFSAATARTPSKVFGSSSFTELLDSFLPDEEVIGKHKELMNSHRLDHMIFPLGPKGEDDKRLEAERTTLTDKEIVTMLAEVNCVVRRIVHGEQARHVYFWSPDNKAREKGVELAYKIKGKLKNDGSANVFAVQVNVGSDREKYA